MVGKKLIGRRFYLHVAYLWAVETGMHVGVELKLRHGVFGFLLPV